MAEKQRFACEERRLNLALSARSAAFAALMHIDTLFFMPIVFTN